MRHARPPPWSIWPSSARTAARSTPSLYDSDWLQHWLKASCPLWLVLVSASTLPGDAALESLSTLHVASGPSGFVAAAVQPAGSEPAASPSNPIAPGADEPAWVSS